ncbi:peptidoglycan-binding protein [Pseudobacillus badius]|uniref:peptidoglycan-binding protein n=1 Tax=Bacillus badius TaxID=1455 RepID=UPI0007B3CA47|nr:peptidoglycan-binding protein [Bacillus badius]
MDLNVLVEKANKKLVGVHTEVAKKAIELVKLCHAKGINILITQGLRTNAEQNALYAQGRTVKYDSNGKKLSIVTNAKGGQSIHNFGLAFDFAVYGKDGKTIEWNTSIDTNGDGYKDYLQVGAIGKTLGLKWGGDFRTFIDYPHFEYTFGLSLAALQAGKRPSGSATIALRKYLQEGDRGSKVKELQSKLVQLGYDIDSVDGIYGQATANAVMVLQRRTGLTADGIAGEKTMAKIEELLKKMKENKPAQKEEPKVEYKKDAAASPAFKEAQAWVKENKISDGTYPQRPVTREEVWAMLHRASKVNK